MDAKGSEERHQFHSYKTEIKRLAGALVLIALLNRIERWMGQTTT